MKQLIIIRTCGYYKRFGYKNVYRMENTEGLNKIWVVLKCMRVYKYWQIFELLSQLKYYLPFVEPFQWLSKQLWKLFGEISKEFKEFIEPWTWFATTTSEKGIKMDF